MTTFASSRPGRLVAAVAAVLLCTACGTALPTPEPAVLTIAASSSVAPLAAALASGFHASQPHVEVRVEITANSPAAGALVTAGRADLALTLLPPDTAKLSRLITTPIAQEALAIIVPTRRSLDGLSTDQVRRVFAGTVRDWAEVNAGKGPIQIAVREEGSGLRALFDAMILQDSAISATALIIPDNQSMLDFVAKTPGAIGYLPAALLDEQVHPLRLDGLAPDPATTYPLMQPIFLVRSETASPTSMVFERWALSDAGQAVVQQRYASPPASPTDQPLPSPTP